MERLTQSNRHLKCVTGIGAIMLMAGSIGFVSITSASAGSEIPQSNPDDNLPEVMILDAVIRDFKPKAWEGGHPDFESFGGTTTVGLVADYLDDDGKPVAADLRGQKIKYEFRDSEGRNINPSMFSPDQGDTAGLLVAGGTGNGLTSSERFAQWYRDTPGVNLSKSISLTLHRTPGTNQFVFDSSTDTEHESGGWFLPINGELYGNFKDNRNYHFTTEINTEFTYDAEANQVFKFTGDDDVWVFINGQLVIDLGGLHPKREQFLDLNRLEWLQDGRTYSLDIFHAERRYRGSNFRIETTLELRAVELPPTAALYD